MRSPAATLTTCLLIAVLGTSALLAGCGQKGPLYLPDQAQQPAKKKPATPATS